MFLGLGTSISTRSVEAPSRINARVKAKSSSLLFTYTPSICPLGDQPRKVPSANDQGSRSADGTPIKCLSTITLWVVIAHSTENLKWD